MYGILMKMSFSNANLKILDADTARALQLERIDGERVRAELKKHLVENEVVLFAHNSYYFTNGGILIKIGENGSSMLLKCDEIELGDEVHTLPKLSFEAILSKHVHQDALVLRNLVLASFVVKSLPECEALMGRQALKKMVQSHDFFNPRVSANRSTTSR